jgi:acetyl esterase
MLSKLILGALGAVVLALLAIYTAFQVNPWPSALLIRRAMDSGGVKLVRTLQKHAPANIRAHLNEQYDASDADAFLDVFYPSKVEKTDQTLPTIIWVHGGGWVGGNKYHIADYLKVLAARGYAVVGVNYSLAPDKMYPTPVRQINTALAYLTQNAERLHIDSTKFILAGDSAGAQIAAQLAVVISAPPYAKALGVAPTIERSKLRGVILYCGFYDFDVKIKRSLRLLLWSNIRTMFWSYFGTKDYLNDPRYAQFVVGRYITSNFPPMFISVGNAEEFASQSYRLAEIAANHGVPVDTLFFPENYAPSLQHEYQFDLDTNEGQLALERSVKFVDDPKARESDQQHCPC